MYGYLHQPLQLNNFINNQQFTFLHDQKFQIHCSTKCLLQQSRKNFDHKKLFDISLRRRRKVPHFTILNLTSHILSINMTLFY